MPLNEIHATSYLRVFYSTPSYPRHSFTLYIQENMVQISSDPIIFTLQTSVNPDTSLEWTVHDIVVEFIRRWLVGTQRIPPMTILSVEVWQSASGDNEFLGYDGEDYSDLVSGSAGQTASAYTLYNFQDADRNNWRIQILDAPDPKPQRTALANPPVTDDDSLQWFVIRGNVPFVTNDGNAITAVTSVNTGYNRHLAKRYGRSVAP